MNGDGVPHTNGNGSTPSLAANNPNVGVHTFDPDASPAQKGAAAGKGKEDLMPKLPNEGHSKGRCEILIDTGASQVIPTITVEDLDKEAAHPNDDAKEATPPAQVEHETHASETDEDTADIPGAIPAAPAPTIPHWYKVGWRQMSGIDNPPPDEEGRLKTLMERFVSERYYGEWYHNAVVIIFAVLASHFFTVFHFGWGWIILLLAFCNTYYTTSITRTRRQARDDIQRELVATRLTSDHETADWLNNFLDRFWLIYEPVLAETVTSTVDQVLSSNTPAYLDSLRLSQFTLGNKAPRIEKVRTFPRTEEDVVQMDWQFSFTPNDLSEMTTRQVASKVNPKIVLSVRVGKGLASAALPILVEDITFSGLMRIRMKLMSNFPHVQTVELCFMEKPVIDYVLKPIGGETFGFDIANLPGLSSFIRETTHSVLGSMMYDPNFFTLNLEQMLSGVPLDTAIGVLQVTVVGARGIKGSKIGGGTPDPFVSLSLNNRQEVARTKYKNNTYNPTWMETKFLLINTLSDTLCFSLYDYNDHRKNTAMGSASFDLKALQEDSTREGLSSVILKDGKDRGELRYDLSFFPVLKAEESGAEVVESNVGIARITIHQAKDLDHSKSLSGELNPMAKLYLGSHKRKAVYSTKPFKHTNSPVWEAAHEFLCADRRSSVIVFKVVDDREFLKDPVVGYMSIRLDDLLSATTSSPVRDWFPLSGCKTGKIRVSADWKPLNMAGSLQGADQYTPPIGVVRLLLDRATDVKNVEATLGGKSDPYVRVQVNNVTKNRTEVVNNNLNPVWDQIIYIPVHSLRETLLLECMDYQHLTKDRSLGSVEVDVSVLAKEGEDKKYPYEATEMRDVEDPIQLDGGKTVKGKLHYKATFVPALKLNGVKFEQRAGHLDEPSNGAADEEGGVATDNEDSSEPHSDVDNQTLAEGATVTTAEGGRHKKAVKSTDTTHTTDTKATEATETNGEKKEDEGVEMSLDELVTEQSGIMVFNVISGHLTRKARLEVLLDDGYWPCFSTPRAHSLHAQWEYVGEGFVKELDFGKVWLRLNMADEGDKDDVIAQSTFEALDFLRSTYDGPSEFQFDDGSTVSIETRYVPVPVTLEPRESVNNQGIVNVDLISGSGIRGVDRGGKSDPYAVFTLNGQKVFKSQTKKKTLTPEWNEDFAVSVSSRTASKFSVEVFDWNQLEQAKSLGTAVIDLNELEPFNGVDRTFPLVSPKQSDAGQIRLRLTFRPQIVTKSRKSTSTFSAAGRTMTQLGGLPVSAGKGMFSGVTAVTGVLRKGLGGGEDDSLDPIAEVPAGQASRAVAPEAVAPEAMTFPTNSAGPASNAHGTLKVTVIDAKDLSPDDCKPYTTIRVGDTEVKTKHTGKTATPEWNETFLFSAGRLTSKLFLWVNDHKTLGKDKLLCEGEVDIWRHLQVDGVSASEVAVELKKGQGLIRLRLEFDPNASPSPARPASIASGTTGPRSMSMSIPSPSRFSMNRRRAPTDDD
ncbi:tricalbin [Fistulina hepatica ATCC 64428]|nr:tricalbin [Fistulina hepatica ATCC 64428]